MQRAQMEKCIEECERCSHVCREAALNECLDKGGPHVEPEHFRLMISCADVCRAAANIMLGNSHVHAAVCAACAEICDACAVSCEKLGMEECVLTCRSCAKHCRETAGSVHIVGGTA